MEADAVVRQDVIGSLVTIVAGNGGAAVGASGHRADFALSSCRVENVASSFIAGLAICQVQASQAVGWST